MINQIKKRKRIHLQCNVSVIDMILVRARFVTNRNSVGFACKKVQTTSFVERGLERLALSRQAAVWFCLYGNLYKDGFGRNS